jgi:molecular chaperone Hsp33
MKETPTILQRTDDICFGFALQNAPVRGQIVSLGPATADEIVSRHELPNSISNMLGQVLALASLAGVSIKFDGKLIVEFRQEYGRKDLPVEFIVAEYNSKKTIRGMAKINRDAVHELEKTKKNPTLKDYFGEGFMLVTLDQGPQTERYQGQIALIGDTIAKVGEEYFERSEQIPTRIILATQQSSASKSHKEWRAEGVLIQKVAGDNARGETNEIWEEACFKFATLANDELLDLNISQGELLLRLFHENGVEAFEPVLLTAKCTCSRERLVKTIGAFDKNEIEHLLEDDGKIHARCEFCNTTYLIAPTEL